MRQAFFIDVEKVQTSCGYAVPLMEFIEDRDTLDRYSEKVFEPLEMVDGMPQKGDLVLKA